MMKSQGQKFGTTISWLQQSVVYFWCIYIARAEWEARRLHLGTIWAFACPRQETRKNNVLPLSETWMGIFVFIFMYVPCILCVVFLFQPIVHNIYTDMRHLTTAIRSKKCVFRRFRRCTNDIECTYTNLESIAFYTPSLYVIAYCS